MSDSERIDRRRFVERLAAGSTAAALVAAPISVSADDNPAADKKDQPPREPVAPPSQELLLLTCLVQRYPSDQLDEVALKGILNDLRGDLARSRILSKFPLKNSDEPSYVFRAYRAAR